MKQSPSPMAKTLILAVLYKTPMSISQLIETTGMSSRTVQTWTDRLVEEGLVVKKKEKAFPFRTTLELTDKGRQQAKKLSEGFKLEEEVERRLFRHGAVMDLQPKRRTATIILGMGFKDMAKTYITPGKLEREYLSFLAKLYTESPRNLLGKHPSSLIELRCAWQLVKVDGWREPDVREGFFFDFPSAWCKLYGRLSEELRGKMAERGLTQKRIFRKLRAFSFPAFERLRLVREGKI